jgi:hypothetical protein
LIDTINTGIIRADASSQSERTEKDIGEIPVDKVVDFRLLREVRRELSGK